MSRFAALAALLIAICNPVVASADDDDRKVAFNNHCRNCHSFKKGDNRLGPSMHGIFGATAGVVEGFRGYSGSLAGLTWDEATLDRFIASPAGVATSTNMIYPPVGDPEVRRKIIAYLRSITEPDAGVTGSR